MPELRDTVAIVTGGAQGIGECIARTLAADGATIFLVDVQEQKAGDVADSLRRQGAEVESMLVDIGDPKHAEAMVSAAISRFGQVDALVNNAGIDAPPGLPQEIDEEHWREIINVDLSGAWWCTKSVLPHMIERGRGKIVSISSCSARGGNPQTSPAYAAAKAGLIGLTAHLSIQLEPFGILVNGILPGATGNTGAPLNEEQKAQYLARYPLGFGGPEPTANAVRFLLRPSGNWVSGAIMNVSGGRVRGF